MPGNLVRSQVGSVGFEPHGEVTVELRDDRGEPRGRNTQRKWALREGDLVWVLFVILIPKW